MRRGALGETAFRLLLIGQSVSAFGDRLVSVALAFAVLDLTGSVTDLGIILTAQTVPVVALVLGGGMWVDRLPRQPVMLGSDVVGAGAQAASALLQLTATRTYGSSQDYRRSMAPPTLSSSLQRQGSSRRPSVPSIHSWLHAGRGER
jgi:MFS family permease